MKNTGFKGRKNGFSVKGVIQKQCGISAGVAQKFRVWFERNLAGMRSGLVGGVEYRRAGALDDRPGDDAWYANAYDRAVLDYTESTTPAEEDFIRSHPLIVLQLLLGLTDMRGIRCMRRGLTRHINSLQQKSYRSRYYAKDNCRRRILAAARRKINMRTTLNPCPTPDQFRAAFAARNDSVEARIRFGGMVHDLECYVDNCLRINEAGEIVGRNGGIKHWLADHVPELYERYKTIMRYKSLARRIRQAVMVRDPVPTSDLLSDTAATGDAVERVAGETPLRTTLVGTTPAGKMVLDEKPLGTPPMEDTHKNYYATDSHCSQRKNADEMWMGGGRVDEISARAMSLGMPPLNEMSRAEMPAGAPSENETPVGKMPARTMPVGMPPMGEMQQVVEVEAREKYYARNSHYEQRQVAAGRVSKIFDGCANTMAGAFRAVDGYMDKHYDEFCGFVEGMSPKSRKGRMST